MLHLLLCLPAAASPGAAAPALVPSSAPAASNTSAPASSAPTISLQATAATGDVVYTIADLVSSASSTDAVKSQRPPSDGPLKVDCRVIITNFMAVDQVKGTFDVQGTIMTVWQDSRLAMPAGATRVQLTDGDVWTPEHDFYNSVKMTIQASKIALLSWEDKSYMIHEEEGATLVLTERFVCTFSMRMSFVSYPFDKHALPIEIDLFGNPAQYVEFRTSQVELAEGLSDPEWAIVSAESDLSLVTKPTGLKYSRMAVHLHVSRLWVNKAFSIYTPLIFIFILSYGSYFVDPGPLPARTALTIISLLTSIAYYGSVSAQLPNRGYMTWVDLYCVSCIASCGVAVALFLRVHWLMRLEKKADFKPADSWIDGLALGPQPEPPPADAAEGEEAAKEPPPPPPVSERIAGYKSAPPSGRLDLLMRTVWPWLFYPTFLLIFVPMTREFYFTPFEGSDFS